MIVLMKLKKILVPNDCLKVKCILGEDEPESKSIFVKVPLKDDPTFASVNVRELVMFTDVLPKLQVRGRPKMTSRL